MLTHTQIQTDEVSSISLHPDIVRTNICKMHPPAMKYAFTVFVFLFGKSCVHGSKTSLYLSCEEGIECSTGEFFVDGHLHLLQQGKLQGYGHRGLCMVVGEIKTTGEY